MRKNEGIALITTLLVALVCLLFIIALMHMVMTSTQTSGSIKRYTTALEAAKGAAEEITTQILSLDFSTNWQPGRHCKVSEETLYWESTCSFCSPLSKCTSHSSPNDIVNNYDWKKDYGSYTVYCKIINTKKTEEIKPDGTTEEKYLYTIDIVAKSEATPEQSWISILYLTE